MLTMHRDRAQDLKTVVESLRAEKRHEAVAHNRAHRPGDFYESLILDECFQVKRAVVNSGQKLSLQKHFHPAEHWVVVNGIALVTRDEDQILVRENESIYLPLGCTHRMENPGRIPLTLIEVQSGSYLGEDHLPETHLIPIAIDAALGRRPLLMVFGDDYPIQDGTCVRDYVHVTDLAEAHCLTPPPA